MNSHLPEDPEYTSEPKVLSPVSPKPLHFPAPDTIPVLENQIDLDFNQTAPHLAAQAAQETTTAPFKPFEERAEGRLVTTAKMEVPGDGAEVVLEQDDANHMDLTLQETITDTVDGAAGTDVNEGGQVTATDIAPIQDNVQASTDLPVEPTQSAIDIPTDANVKSQSLDLSQTSEAQSHPNGLPPTQVTEEGVVDYQKLLDSLSVSKPVGDPMDVLAAPAPPDASTTAIEVQAQPPAPGTDQSASASQLVAPAGLPPRPPPQAQPSIHPNYNQSSDIRNYHPHAQNPAAIQTQAQPHASATPTQAYPGASFPPGTTTSAASANGLPPPPVPSFQAAPGQAQSPSMQALHQQMLESARELKVATGEILGEDETPWTEETKKLYEQFLNEERHFVQEGNWEQFPMGSRLFVGNLSSERVTKRDIFHVFHQYGRLAQISIKQAYGFVQFFDIASCDRAMHAEQGRIIRGKKINLEVSKPQKNSRQHDAGRRRSRSPDRTPAGVDRYVSGSSQGQSSGGRRNDREARSRRSRDDYRPNRSPSPPRGFRAPRERSRDRHGRYRSRSRSPVGRDYRPSRDDDDDLPLPKRAPRDVPDLQVIVLDELDRNFIGWVEQAFISRGVRVDVLLLSPRLSEAAVIKRQVIEGVVAVTKLTRQSQHLAKIPLQVFDRRAGADIRFEEYADLEPTIAAEVVLRAKAQNQAPPSYGYGYGAGTISQPQSAVSASSPNLGSLISTMDPASLQKLLGAMQQQPSPTTPHGLPPQTALTPDLAKLLSGAAGAPPSFGQPPPSQDPLVAMRNNPALASLLAQQGLPRQQQPTPQQQMPQQIPHQMPQRAPSNGGAPGQPDMADILARLGTYRR